jgi:hypothetical protein
MVERKSIGTCARIARVLAITVIAIASSRPPSVTAGGCTIDAECNDGNVCTDDVCDTGACQNTNNTAPCDDGNGCTIGDACAAGVCAGVPNPCDDGNACTVDSCQSGACVNAYAPYPGCCTASGECNDGSACSSDACQGGTCVNVSGAYCCDTDAECDDGEICTADDCAPTNTASVLLNGTSAFVTMGAAPGLGAAQFTVEAWFKRTDTGTPNSTGASGIANLVPLVAKGAPETDGSNVDANYILGINTAGNVIAADFEQFGTCTGGTGDCTTAPYGPGCDCTTNANCQSNVCGNAGLNHPVSGTTAITMNVWHHGAATYDGTTLRVYLDGSLEATLTVGAVNPRHDSIQPAGVGTMQKSAGSSTPHELGFFAGSIDEVRIWNVARSLSEIQAGLTTEILAAPGLIGRWGFNEGMGSSAVDSTTPLETGTLSGGAAWDAGAPAMTGNACRHDAVPNCCHVQADCNDGNPCTTDVCEGNVCSHAAISGCCLTAAQCDDGNVCTTDACIDNVCSNTANTAACNDGITCTGPDVCSGGVCGGPPIANCCIADAQCDDGNICTFDACPPVDPNLGPGGPAGLTFDGTDDYVTMGVAPALGGAQFTVETWFRRTGTGVSNTTGNGGITNLVPLVAKGAPEAEASSVDAHFILGINTAGNVLAADFEQFGTCTGGTGTCTTPPYGPGCDCSTNANCQSNVCANAGLNHPVSGTTAITMNVWHHGAATYDGTTWRLYLDGNLEATLVVGAVDPRFDSVQPMGLGTMQKSASSPGQLGFFAGQLDEVRVWSAARTQSDIQAAMHREILSATGLTGRWGLNEGSGTIAHDATGGGENGTLTNGPAWTLLPGDPLSFGTPERCDHDPVPNCCLSVADCNDGDICTTDACTNNVCSHAAIPACCVTSAQCGDGNECTTDQCIGNVCSNTAIPGCGPCSSSAQCDDLNACTLDVCPTQGNAFALQFDGTNDYVTMGSAPNLGATSFTLETWFKKTGLGSQATTGVDSPGTATTPPLQAGCTAVPLITKGRHTGTEGTTSDVNYFLGIQEYGTCSTNGVMCTNIGSACASPGTGTCNSAGNNKLCADFESTETATNNYPITGRTQILDNQWYHAAVTFDQPSGTWKMYLNGNLEAVRMTGVKTPRSDSVLHFALGTALDAAGAASGFFAGQLDEVRVWNRALTQTEVQSGMSRAITSETGLIGRWGLNEGSLTSAADSTTPAENGTLTNGPTWASSGIPNLGTASVCQHVFPTSPSAGCCLTAADCNDGNACTADTCQNGSCVNAAIDNCCMSDAACNDANTCTADSCTSANTGALQFNGTTQYVTMSLAPALGSTAFTVECKFRRDGTGTSTSTGTGGLSSVVPLISKGRGEADGTSQDAAYLFGIDTATNRLAADFESTDGSTGAIVNNFPLIATSGTLGTTTGWRHAAATYDGRCWTLYLDNGANNLDAVGTLCPGRTPRFDSIQHFGIATAMTSTGTTAGFFNGAIDEVRVWSRALSEIELEATMNSQLTSGIGLIGRWGLNEASGNALDSDPNGDGIFINGTLTGSPTRITTGLAFLGGGTCAHAPTNVGQACDDGSACTSGDACNGSGVCSGTFTGGPDVCDGIDNDCNASTSDGSADAGVGVACDGSDSDLCMEGVTSCVGGLIVCSDNTDSSLDVCNNLDDDCDTASADGSEDPAIDVPCDGPDSDLCMEGVTVCAGGAIACSDVTVGTLDVCNDLDDDCDAASSDGSEDDAVGVVCDGSDSDLCMEGVTSCVGGAIVCSDTSGDTLDVCNDLDDDCDPASADGSEDPAIGVPCDGPDSDLCMEGVTVCAGGAIACSDVTVGTLDVCNDLDDDCDAASSDGSEDDAVGVACDGSDSDLCMEGVTSCVGGAIVCSDTTGDALDLCNGLDDDCDPASSDGSEDPALGVPCDGADSDLCAEGVTVCAGDAIACSDTTGDALDLCNGLDDDCDPASADGSEDPALGVACDGADSDLCAEGVTVCAGDAIACSDTTGDTLDLCNGLDDDCDGSVDEGSLCDDANDCTVDTCNGVAGCSNVPVVCNDGNVCTDDTCNPIGGCVHVDNSVACDDGVACTTGDVCTAGSCVGTPVPPPEVEGLTGSRGLGGEASLAWADQGDPLVYDVSSGLLSQLTADGSVVGAACIANDLGTASYDDARPDPPADDGYYYIVRGQTTCGAGSYGFASGGGERLPAGACP